MLRRDYILAIIEEMIQAIARAVGFYREGKPTKADGIIDSCYKILKIDRSEVEKCDPDEVIPFLLEEYRLDGQLLESMGDLFCAQSQSGDENSRRYLLFARNIYRFLNETERSYSLPRLQKLAQVEEALLKEKEESF